MSVVHCKKNKYDVYIGRPSIYGNPFVIGKDGDRDEVILKYKEWIFQPEQSWLRDKIRKELCGKILGCYCAPYKCHGDIIELIANQKVYALCPLCNGEDINCSVCQDGYSWI